MAKFNLHDNAWVNIKLTFVDKRVIEKEEHLSYYSSLIHNTDTLFDERNSKTRIVGLYHKLDKTYWYLSVAGNEEYNELFFYEMKNKSELDDNLEFAKENLKKREQYYNKEVN